MSGGEGQLEEHLVKLVGHRDQRKQEGEKSVTQSLTEDECLTVTGDRSM